MTKRGRLRFVAAAMLVVSAMLAAPSAPALPGVPQGLAAIDPALPAQIAASGLAPAILTWDRTKVDRTEVAGYLDSHGLEAHMLEGLSVAFACAGSSADVATLATAPGALSVWGDHALHPALDKSTRTAFRGDPHTVWDGPQGVTGKGVAIGVVDTGVDATHPDLDYGYKTKLNVRVAYGREDVLGPGGDPCGLPQGYTPQLEDSELTSGHGTHLSSVAAGDGTVSGGRYTGVAPGADIIGVGIADTVTPQAKVEGTGQLSLLGALAGMNYVLLTGLEGCFPGPVVPPGPYCESFVPVTAKVILAGWTQDGLHDPWHPMTFAIRDLSWYGMTVVLPVGNKGPAASNCSAAATCYFNPFAVGAIGVAATPKTSRTALADFSSRGDPNPQVARGEQVRYEPFLSAPGTNVVAARRPGVAPYAQPPGSILGGGPGTDVTIDRRYVSMSGTSISAAHVAGAIALMQEAAVKGSGCYLTTQQVTNILRSTATPMPGYASWEVGAGSLDVTAAVNAARGGGPLSPDPWMCPPSA